MKKYILLCVCSTIFGGTLAVILTDPPQPQQSAAQDVDRAPASLRPATDRTAAGNPRFAPPDPLDDLTPEERINVAVYEKVNRSVVNINTKAVRSDAFPLFEFTTEGAGSGSVIDRQGRILTNYHVVEDAREIQVALFDGKTYPARLVGQDPSNDVAVIQVEAPAASLYPVVFGDSTRLRVGQRVFAIGNPFGLERTLTTGIISSLNRSLPSRTGRTIKSIIQIDAAINPGNSGGPLLDSHGRLIGMNTAIASKTGESAGVGFAIPAGIIARVVPQLIEKGKIVRPDAGILKVYQTERGLLIATLAPGGPAEKAGLRGPRLVRQRKQQGPFVYESRTIDRSAADLIVAVDGQKATTADEFLTLIESKQPGQQVTITVIRQGREESIPVRLSAGSEND
ncbi:MAG: S1C family serine protease [Pirellulales bacterium]